MKKTTPKKAAPVAEIAAIPAAPAAPIPYGRIAAIQATPFVAPPAFVHKKPKWS